MKTILAVLPPAHEHHLHSGKGRTEAVVSEPITITVRQD